MDYKGLLKALRDTGIPIAEGAWRNAYELHMDYAVIALDGRNDLLADGAHAEKMAEGTLDLYTYRSQGIDKALRLESVMDQQGIPWHLNFGPQYETETELTHWEWVLNCFPPEV